MTNDATTPPPAPSAPAPAAPVPTVWMTFQARDATAMIDYLTDTFGFEATAVYRDGDVVVHAQLDWPEGGGVMFGDNPASRAWHQQPGTAGAYVVTDRVTQVYQRALAHGATIIRELNETDYGSDEFAVRDPEGNLWSFGTYRGEPRVAGGERPPQAS